MDDVLAVCCYGELEMHGRDVIRDTLLLIFLLFYKNVISTLLLHYSYSSI